MNRIIVDTNILVYLLTDTLDADTDALVRDWETQVFVSSTSVMEFINLIQSGRVRIHKPEQFSAFRFIEDELGFRILYVSREHLQQLEQLPTVDGHNDPNDRLIISQAIADRLELVSSDTKFTHYRKWGLHFTKAEHSL